MSYSWKILKSAVEQEILFSSEEVYENYLAKYEKERKPYEIVEETERGKEGKIEYAGDNRNIYRSGYVT